MKRFGIPLIFALLLFVGSSDWLVAQSQPNGQYLYRFTNRPGESTDGIITYSGATSTVAIDNSRQGCIGWQMTYNSEGFTAISINLQTAPKQLVVGSSPPSYTNGGWSTFGGTASVGSLPITSTAQGNYVGYGYYPYLRINLATATGTGSVDVTLSCWKSITYANLGTGGSGTPGGSDTQLQYNNASNFGGIADFTFASHTIAGGASSILDMSAGADQKFAASSVTGGCIILSSGHLTFSTSCLSGIYGAIGSANPWTGKNTFQPTATTEGLNITCGGLPSAPTAGAISLDGTCVGYTWNGSSWLQITPSVSTWATLTDGSTVTWAIGSIHDASATLTFTTHGGSRALKVTNAIAGGNYVLKLIQDGTGGEGLTLDTAGCNGANKWKVIGGGSGAVSPSTGAAAVDVLAFTLDDAGYCLVTFGKNYN